jgi:P-type Mg2+ transporter
LNSKFETGIRNPLNLAILEAGCSGTEDYEKCDEIPFDFERRRVSVVVKRNAESLLITKGAPESVIQQCSEYESAGRAIPLTDDQETACLQKFHELSNQGYRVLAVAYRDIASRDAYSTDDESALVLAGYLAFADPPRPDTEVSATMRVISSCSVNTHAGISTLSCMAPNPTRSSLPFFSRVFDTADHV